MSDAKKLGRTFRLRVRTVTPLHIGTDSILLRDYDYRTMGKETFVLNQDEILAREYERTGQAPMKPAGQYANERDLDDSKFVRYRLSGATTLDQIHEQIKDAYGNVYLPGSTLKGALRTVILVQAMSAGRLTGITIGERAKTAAQPFERALFRPSQDDANHDLLRALQISDSKPIDVRNKPLLLQHVRVITDDAASIPIAVEAIPRLVTFEVTMYLDDYLIKDKAKELGWQSSAAMLEQLPTLANEWADRQIARELKLAKEKGWGKAAEVYSKIQARPRSPGVFLLQIGWGTGWESKTLGTLLPDAQLRQARGRFELGKPPRWHGHGQWKPDFDKPFPKGHRLTIEENKNSPPQEPLGWVLLEMKQT